MRRDARQLQTVLARVAARDMRSRVLDNFIHGLLIGETLALIVLFIDRLTTFAIPWWIYAIIAIVPAVAFGLSQLQRNRSIEHLATKTDRQLNLKDHLGTATRLGQLEHCDEAFASQLQQEAQSIAKQVDPKQVVPILWNHAVPALVGAVALVVAIIFVPYVSWGNSQSPPVVKAADGSASASLIRGALPPPDALSPESSQNDRALLNELAAELEDPTLSDKEATQLQQQSAAKMQQLADSLNKRADQYAAEADSMAEQFRRASDASPPPANDPNVTELAQSLSRGDFDNAADILDSVSQDSDEKDTQLDREGLADYLDRLAESLDQQSDQEVSPPDAQEQLEQLLQDPRLARELVSPDAPPIDEEALAQTLEENGLDPDVARELAEDLKQLSEDQKQQEEIEQQKRQIREALEETAEELRQQPSAPQEPDQPKENSSESSDSEKNQSQDSKKQQSDPESSSGQSQEQEQKQQPSQEVTPSQASEQSEQEESADRDGTPSNETTAVESETDAGDSERDPQPSGDQQEGARPQQQQSEQNTDSQGQSPSEDDQKDDGLRQGDPHSEEGRQSGETQRQSEPSGDQTQDRQERQSTPASEALRKLAEKQRAATRQRTQAEQLDQALRQLVSEQPQRPDGFDGGGQSVDLTQKLSEPGAQDDQLLDLRNGTEPDVATTRWLTPDGEVTNDLAGQLYSTPGAVPTTEAKQIAERATNASTVPRRYHELIRRYFEQLGDQP